MSQRNPDHRSRFRFEFLERRQMLSATPAAEAERLAAAGFVPVIWNGQETYAKAGEWIVNVGGTAAGVDDPAGLVNSLAKRLGKGDDLRATQRLGKAGQVLVKTPKGAKAADLRASLAQIRGFKYLEPNFLFRLQQTPDDPSYADGTLWGLHSADDQDIDAPEAWDDATGSQGQIVGVIDTGVDYTHPDLYQNVWINQAEIPDAVREAIRTNAGWDVDGDGLITFVDLNDPTNQGPGKITDVSGNRIIDGKDLLAPYRSDGTGGWADNADALTDPNTFADDLIGWNFVNDSNDPMDDQGHGTHVAGTIAARGNNGRGVVGVNWRGQIMGLKFLAADGYGTGADAILSLDYVTDLNQAGVDVNVTNNSYGGEPWARSFYDAIKRNGDAGLLFVAAAGNGDWLGRAINNDTTPHYPSSYGHDDRTFTDPNTGESLLSLENVIAVTATDANDAKASWANYGTKSVDLAAPGVNIYSLAIGGGYKYNSGTSMAAPHVAGAAALAWSLSPTAAAADVKGALLRGVDVIPSLNDPNGDGSNADRRVATGGRLNLDRTLAVLPSTTAPATPAGFAASVTSSTRIELAWNDVNGEIGYTLERSTNGGAFVALPALQANTTAFSDTTVQPGHTYQYRLKATNAAGSSGYAVTDPVTTPVVVVPPTPTNLVATSDGTTSTINLQWTDSGDETGFRVRRSTTATFDSYVDVLVSANDTGTVEHPDTVEYPDTGLAAGTTYYYRVYAFNASADSEPSNAASASTAAAADVGTGKGLLGEYYDNSNFTSLKMSRTEAVNFNWGTGSPSKSGKTKIAADTFSVRWRGQAETRYDEAYTFYVKADDGLRLWIDGKLVLNIWRSNTSTWATTPIAMKRGSIHDIQLDYYEGSGSANVQLMWSSTSVPKQVIPATQLYTSVIPPVQTTSQSDDLGTDLSSVANANVASGGYGGVFSGTTIGRQDRDRVADKVLDLDDEQVA